MKKVILIFLLILSGILILHGAKSIKQTIPLRFDHYHTNEMVDEGLQLLQKAFPQLTKLDIAGKSEEGRIIYCLTINNAKTGKALNKPGIYVDGNIHGNEIQGAEVSLYLANYLLTNYNTNKQITELVNKKCFYIVPMVNPDGRYHFLNDPNHDSSSRSLRRPHDDDRDGLVDEDFPEDLDGDGNICWMRKKDKHGMYKADPLEPRMLVEIKPGEKGEWTLLGMEGIDNDGDGLINEDSEGYVDPNRNWGYDWAPPYVQGGAGDYPFSGVGLRALSQFIRKRPNICMVWAFHNYSGLFLRGPSRKVHGEFHPKDVEVYDLMGEQAERITPEYKYLILWKDLYETYGDFTEWMCMVNGAYAFVGELFMPDSETFQTRKEKKEKPLNVDAVENVFDPDPELERQRLKFNDHLTQGKLFKPWKAYKHPTYGNIEIGGWVKMSSRISDPFMLEDLVHRNASAVIYSAKQTPEVNLKVLGIKKVGNQLYRIRIRLKNEKAMPTMSYHAQQVKLYPKDQLTVSGAEAKVLASGKILDIYRNQVKYKEHRPEIQFLVVPGFDKVDYQFMVSGKGKVTIHYKSRHAGKITRTINLE